GGVLGLRRERERQRDQAHKAPKTHGSLRKIVADVAAHRRRTTEPRDYSSRPVTGQTRPRRAPAIPASLAYHGPDEPRRLPHRQLPPERPPPARPAPRQRPRGGHRRPLQRRQVK